MINLKGAWGKTALHIAARKGNWNFTEALLKLGAETGAMDDKGWKPIHYAVRSGSVEATEGLLKYSRGTIKEFSIPLRAAARVNDKSSQWISRCCLRPSLYLMVFLDSAM